MTKRKTFADYLADANDRLHNAAIRLTIEQRGSTLSLRGTLPPRPGQSGKARSQRLALGFPANRDGLGKAEAEAQTIAGAIARDRFDWSVYCPSAIAPIASHELPVRELVDRLTADYLRSGGNPDTWRVEALSQFRKIANWDRPIDVDELQGIIEAIEPTKRSRKRAAIAFSRLAEAAGLEERFFDLQGEYTSDRPINPRDIPDDDEIAHWRGKIDDPLWRNAFSLQAVYGLRNYEVFKLDVSEWPIVFCDRGKTNKERYIMPLYPEWAERWFEGAIALPAATGKNTSLGHRVSEFFAEMRFPFNAYDLRHAWARRAVEFGWGTAEAALQMGHGEGVHTRIYKHWIDRSTHQRVYDRLRSRPDRPIAPI